MQPKRKQRTKSESVTENRNRYRNIFKELIRILASVFKKPKNTDNRRKNTENTENSVFANDTIYYLNYMRSCR